MPSSAEPARVRANAEVASSASGFDNIHALYDWMQGTIMDGADSPNRDELIASEIRPNSRQTATQRMDIYTRDFYSRFVEVLAVDFEAAKLAMGDESWGKLVRAFVYAHPSRTHNINDYGYELVEFIATQEIEHRDFLQELMRLEVEMAKRHTLAPEEFLAQEAFGEMSEEDWEQANLKPRASVASHRYEYDVLSYLHDALNGEEPEIPTDPEETYVQVYRKDLETWRQRLSKARHEALQSLIAGDPLGVALAKGGAAADCSEEEFAGQVQEWFADWMGDGIFCAIVRKGEG